MPYLKRLNKLQFEAATHGLGPLLILAGAGSGKTSVLTARIAHLVLKRGVEPSAILAVTFTNKAAGEIRERLEDLVGDKVKELTVGTFHTLGLKILREEAKTSSIPVPTIYDEEEQTLLVRLVMSELSIDDKELPFKSVVYEINLAKNDNLSPQEFSEKADDNFKRTIAPIYERYQKKLQALNAIDFGDLICRPIRMFTAHPDMLARYQERFKYILIDEYQDTNQSQYALTSLLSSTRKNICVVGDPDQAIYGWRGADIKNILRFQKDFPDAKVVKLEQNYRSTKNILSASNSVIKNNSERIEKSLWTLTTEGEPVVYEECLNEYMEARFVVNKIRAAMSKEPSLKFKDFTILYRTNTQSRPFEELFFEEGIPYNIVGGFRFFDRKEIKDALSYLKALANPEDSLNFLRIINVPPRGIGKSSLDKVHRIAEGHNLTLFQAFKKTVADGVFQRGSVPDFIRLFEGLKREINNESLHEFTSRVLHLTGYMEFWEKKRTEDAEERLKNLESLVAAIKNYEVNHPKATIKEYLNLVALMSDSDGYDGKSNRVTLMSIHSAKGLEFPFVFIGGMEEGIFPHKRSMDEDSLEEERRLCYVAMTRAKRQLYLLSAKNRSAGKETLLQLKSRFIDEIDPAFIKRNDVVPAGTAQDHIETIRKLLGK
ncbi:MAG: UvrD-helicase domain-containing protein [Deltaproteobacteria bacterium]|nr:UvrD-helicase domain-containing protein [Deltaproteobacteria bacterium]